MKVYELIAALAKLPAMAEVFVTAPNILASEIDHVDVEDTMFVHLWVPDPDIEETP